MILQKKLQSLGKRGAGYESDRGEREELKAEDSGRDGYKAHHGQDQGDIIQHHQPVYI